MWAFWARETCMNKKTYAISHLPSSLFHSVIIFVPAPGVKIASKKRLAKVSDNPRWRGFMKIKNHSLPARFLGNSHWSGYYPTACGKMLFFAKIIVRVASRWALTDLISQSEVVVAGDHPPIGRMWFDLVCLPCPVANFWGAFNKQNINFEEKIRIFKVFIYCNYINFWYLLFLHIIIDQGHFSLQYIKTGMNIYIYLLCLKCLKKCISFAVNIHPAEKVPNRTNIENTFFSTLSKIHIFIPNRNRIQRLYSIDLSDLTSSWLTTVTICRTKIN